MSGSTRDSQDHYNELASEYLQRPAWPIYNPSMIPGFGRNVQSAALSHQNSGS